MQVQPSDITHSFDPSAHLGNCVLCDPSDCQVSHVLSDPAEAAKNEDLRNPQGVAPRTQPSAADRPGPQSREHMPFRKLMVEIWVA